MAINIDLTFSIPTNQELTDFCKYHDYKVNIPDPNPKNAGQIIPNPETQAQFVKRIVINFFRESIKAQRTNDAQKVAREAKIVEVDALIII